MTRRAAALTLLLLAAGCVGTSPPVTYVQLTTASSEAGTAPGPSILVDAVQVPDYLLRNQLLRRVDDHELRYDATARWAEPLDLGVQRVIAGNLATTLDSAAVTSFPTRSGGDADWRVAIALRNFEAGARNARILADITLSARGGETVESWQFASERALPTDSPVAIASTLSALLSELGAEIAARIDEGG
jgi:uncharacterized lipoprotein YmbA